MKRAFIIGASVALNIGLVVALAVRPSLAPAAVRDFILSHSATAEVRPAAKPAAVTLVPRSQLWATLDTSGDLTGLIARLRQAGFPPGVIRAVVSAEISRRYDSRTRALIESDPKAPFWKAQPSLDMNSKSFAEYDRLWRERSNLLRDLLKDPFFTTDDVTTTQRRQYGNLPRGKIDAIQRIEDDYAEMGSQVRAAMNGVTLPEDRAKLALLEREKQADLATVLSPEELADYQMRSSPLTRMLARQLGGFDASNTEFRAIFDAQQAFGQKVAVGGSMSGVAPEERQAAQAQLVEQLKSSLGDTRYADYMRETDRTYQQLTALTSRENIPPESTIRAYNMGASVAQDSNRIFDDSTLSSEQKAAALQTLAQTTRSQLLTLLGPTAGAEYIKLLDRSWLNRVERGAAVTFSGVPSNMMTTVTNGGAAATIGFGNSPEFRTLPSSPKPGP